ncbi:hypothetical protein [Glycomyces sp. NPDC021274]|uniref:hypothetical protein n=1 Tax=Glycomyces sp. NPDC021274 TaxID=3155120 RepID=UPI0033D27341
MSSTEREPAETTGRPRWVKLAAVIAGLAILVLLAVLVFGGEEHGPMRHGLGSVALLSGVYR